MVFVLLPKARMDPKPQKPSFLFANPLTAWTELAFKFWGFGKTPAERSAPERPAVAVIPTADAQSPHPAKEARADGRSKRPQAKAKLRGKNRSKRARR
jgi:hypothetical protein